MTYRRPAMITEPDVTLTDYGLAIECALFTYLVLRHGNPQQPLRTWFALFFGSVSAAALTGGTVHGFFLNPDTAGHIILWRATLIAIGVSALAGWGIGATLLVSTGVARRIILVAAVEFVAYSVLVLLVSQRFMFAVINYLPAVIWLALALAIMYARVRQRPVLLGLAGLLLTFLAAGVQQGGIALHPIYFNHNALYHAIQAVGLFMIFRSARWFVARGWR
jgi:hypothetical protein